GSPSGRSPRPRTTWPGRARGWRSCWPRAATTRASSRPSASSASSRMTPAASSRTDRRARTRSSAAGRGRTCWPPAPAGRPRARPDEGRPVVERLEAIETERKSAPGAFGSVELRARLLEATGAGEKAVTLLRAHAARAGARPEEVLLPISSLVRQKRYELAL